MSARVLLFGGSFDPIHHGHLIVARAAGEILGAQSIVLVPSARPPHRAEHERAPASARLAMCRLAVEGGESGSCPIAVSDWEQTQPGPNYTLLTVRHFRATLGATADICWLIGMDNLRELHEWHRPDELVRECTIVTAGRAGVAPPDFAALEARVGAAETARIRDHLLPTPRIDISATAIRARVRRRESIRYLVPESVRAYIAANGLYRAPLGVTSP